jgi:hypothetical protein
MHHGGGAAELESNVDFVEKSALIDVGDRHDLWIARCPWIMRPYGSL